MKLGDARVERRMETPARGCNGRRVEPVVEQGRERRRGDRQRSRLTGTRMRAVPEAECASVGARDAEIVRRGVQRRSGRAMQLRRGAAALSR